MSENDVYLALVPVLDTSSPNFRSAGWRIIGAVERLKQIGQLVPVLSSESGYPAVRAPKSDPDALTISLQEWSWSQLPTARKLTLLASDVLHQMRTALDYCAFHAVWLDGGRPRNRTSFPLVTVRENWGNEKRKALPGIKAHHAAWIRSVQPFEGVAWAQQLVELSNRDKHRTAAEVVPTYRCTVNRRRRYADPLGDADYLGYAVDECKLELRIAPALHAGDMGQDTSFPLEVTLARVVKGVTEITNQFLVEAGIQPIFVEFPDLAL